VKKISGKPITPKRVHFPVLCFILILATDTLAQKGCLIFNDDEVINTCSTGKALTFEEAGLQFAGISEMKAEVNKISVEMKTPPFRSAWRYVIDNSSFCDDTLFSQSYEWLRNPEVFINSVGFGICADRAFVLAALWKSMGFGARVWALSDNHAVAEVNDGSGWKMFDPDKGCYFEKEDTAAVASVAEIASDIALKCITRNPRQTLADFINDEEYCLPFDQPSSVEIRALYQSGKNLVSDSLLSYRTVSDTMLLPGRSELHFWKSDSLLIEANIKIKNLVEIKLLPGSEGMLYLPLMPLWADGQFVFKKSGESYAVSGHQEFDFGSAAIDSFYISATLDTSSMLFLANGIKSEHEPLFNPFSGDQSKKYMRDELRFLTYLNEYKVHDTIFTRLVDFSCNLDMTQPRLNSQKIFNDRYAEFVRNVYSPAYSVLTDSVYRANIESFHARTGHHVYELPFAMNSRLMVMLFFIIRKNKMDILTASFIEKLMDFQKSN